MLDTEKFLEYCVQLSITDTESDDTKGLHYEFDRKHFDPARHPQEDIAYHFPRASMVIIYFFLAIRNGSTMRHRDCCLTYTTALSSSECIRLLVSGALLGSWESPSGCVAHFYSGAFGIKKQEFSARSVHVFRFYLRLRSFHSSRTDGQPLLAGFQQ
jgi:hypothetical protein